MPMRSPPWRGSIRSISALLTCPRKWASPAITNMSGCVLAFETVAAAAKKHGKSMGVGGVREDLEFQTWLLKIGVR